MNGKVSVGSLKKRMFLRQGLFYMKREGKVLKEGWSLHRFHSYGNIKQTASEVVFLRSVHLRNSNTRLDEEMKLKKLYVI